jgi:flagellar capping protein FliD
MPVLKSMRLLNEILDGTISTSTALTAKLSDSEALGQFHNIVNVTSLAQRMALVPEAMTIIASNEIAMGAIQNSKVNISNFLTLGVLYPRFGGCYAGSIDLGTKSSHYFVRADMGTPSTDTTLATRNMAKWDDAEPQSEDETTLPEISTFPWYPIEYGKVDPLSTNNGDLLFDGAAITAAVSANTAAAGSANTSDLAAILHCIFI